MALRPLAAASLIAFALTLGACQDGTFGGGGSTRHLTPIPPKTLSLMQTKGMAQGDPILIRAYKKEAEMEVWKRGSSGQYALLKTFPICRWSGQLGPKTKQGDRQAPEGFYSIAPGQMNPNSAYYLSFDTGYPNAFDQANGRTGNYIMVHGTCSSAGCFAMTDESIAEIYAIAREAFAGGQRAFQFQSYPFRMTAQNVTKFRNDPNTPFWKNLKEGSDYSRPCTRSRRSACAATATSSAGPTRRRARAARRSRRWSPRSASETTRRSPRSSPRARPRRAWSMTTATRTRSSAGRRRRLREPRLQSEQDWPTRPRITHVTPSATSAGPRAWPRVRARSRSMPRAGP